MEKETGKHLADGKLRVEGAKKAKRPSRLTRQQKGLAAVAAVLAVALTGVLAWRSLFVRPELPGPAAPDSPGPAEPADWGGGVRPRSGGERKSEDYYTVLILGRDTGGGGNTDTILLASYDVTNQKAAVMSIPRDTMVNVSWDVKKINSVYNACGQGKAGIDGLYREISQLVGFEPDYQVVVEWEAVGALVDAVGGVEFDVPYDMDYHDPVQNLVIEQAKGLRLLSGEDAMQVIRWRCNDNASPYGHRKKDGGIGDSGRMEVQQAFLKAVLRQLMKPENVLNIGPISKAFQENVETDLSFQNILWFGRQALAGGLRPEDVEFFTMPWRGAKAYSRTESKRLGKYTELDYVTPAAGKLLEIVNGRLSPYAEIFSLSDLDIMSVNADGSIASTTGHVEDGRAAAPPVKPGTEPSREPAPSGSGTEPVTPPAGGDGGADTPPESGDGPAEPTAPPEPAAPEEPTVPQDPGFSVIEPPPAG